ncbi:transcription antitermination factor NusB [Neomegalonema sp.]|uniref:RsmB/NOP family class I SAM-dependent RNA methyltransferase n=1 Tax=Neomegalonema sp. TaxID=2039713 RepID=UPI00261FCF36|nr:transcription antitermination factor NusB [Neomegalonema sp.]MDD2868830.1 transcription antitermination factor NusB [Neomegalonema sp.]
MTSGTIPQAGLPARAAAVQILEGVLADGRRLDELWAYAEGLSARDAGFARALTYAALREFGRLQVALATFLPKPPEGRAGAILLCGAAELLVLKGAPHAAVDCAVRLAKGSSARALAPLVNAVLRRVSEVGPEAFAELDPELNAPDWLIRRLKGNFGAAGTLAILAAHRAGAPLDLTPRDPAEAALWAEKLGAQRTPGGASLRLQPQGAVTALPGFAEGAWWAQDAAAALPARMLGDVRGLRVLDLCAAPGGKTLQLAAAGAEVTALDVSAERMERLSENLLRTGLKAELVVADALDWGAESSSYDAILIDAPCSASGTIRRHPDLPHLRGAKSGGPEKGLALVQDRLLRRAAEWLRPGGAMVYAVCSLWPEEGPQRVTSLLKARPDLRREAPPAGAVPPELLDASGALSTRPDLWPEIGGMDGFHASLMRKAPA